MMTKKENSAEKASISSVAMIAVIIFLVTYALYVGSHIFVPFMIAVCVWYLINALARGFLQLRFGVYKLSRGLSYLLAIASFLSAMWIIYSLISYNVSDIIKVAPQYRDNFEKIIPDVLAFLHIDQKTNLTELINLFNPAVFIGMFVKTFTGIAGNFLVVMFYTGFLLYEQQFFRRKIDNMIKDPQTEKRMLKIFHNIDIQIQRYIWVKTFISAATGVMTWLFMRYMGVDFAQFWGLIAFVLNFIPYIGSLIAIVMPSLVALIQFGDISTALICVAGLSVIQISLGSILDPRMMGDSLNLSPICIILSLGIWGSLWGIPGMFLSIPILAMMVITFTQFDRTRPIAVLLSKTGDIENKE